MQTDDQQLVDLVRALPASELAREQIELLWERFNELAELRTALIDEAPGADYLREAFGRFELPVEESYFGPSGAGSTSSSPDAPPRAAAVAFPQPHSPVLVRMSWLPMVALALCILAPAVIALLLPVFWFFSSGPRTPVAPPPNSTATSAADEPLDDGITPPDVADSQSPTVTPSDADSARIKADNSADADPRENPSEAAEKPVSPPRDETPAPPVTDPPTATADDPSDDAVVPDDPVESVDAADADDHSLFVVTDDKSHPLLVEMNKEGYNVWAELKVALDEGAYGDVLRMMRLTPPGSHLGLLPDPSDEHLFVPFNSLIAIATREHPQLLDEMRTDFGPVAQVRLAAALAEADLSGVESVAAQFYGTRAAAEAHRWLADRALSGGSFRAAIRHYRQAMSFGFRQFDADLNARARLAGAMLGIDLGGPVTLPVELGGTRMSAAEFEGVVEQQRERNAELAGPSPAAFSQPADVPPAFPPAQYQPRRWSSMPVGPRGWVQFDGDAWRSSTDTDWPAWCLSAAPAGRLVILSNRQHVKAVDLVTGHQAWYQEFDDSRSYPSTWNWGPMPPLVIDDRIYLRRIPRTTGPELVCLDRDTGRVLWDSRPGDHVSSRAFWFRGSLVAVTADSTEPSFPANPRRRRLNAKQRVFHLHLTAFDPASGEVLAKRPLVRLRDHWCGVLPCRAAPVGDDLLVTAGGIALFVTLDGDIRWLRRQPYTLKKEESLRHNVYHAPPLVDDDRVFTFQPGAKAVECLDLETGRQIWQTDIPDATRVVGLTADRLIVQADAELMALETDNGKVAWQNEPEGVTQAYLCGGPGGLAYVDRVTPPYGAWRFDVVWLAPSTGDVVQRHRLTEFPRRGRTPYLPQCGPFFRLGERLFVGVSEEHPRPKDRELFELVP